MDASLRWHDEGGAPFRRPSEGWGPYGRAAGARPQEDGPGIGFPSNYYLDGVPPSGVTIPLSQTPL